jgi:hypothetical protein
MALASSVLMFAGSPQAFLGVASVQESLFLLMDILPAYVRQLRGELEHVPPELNRQDSHGVLDRRFYRH